MGTLDHIVNKYSIDLKKESPFRIHCGRFEDIPKLFNELGFSVGAEIGVHRAKYSEYLFRGIPGLRLFGIDLWESYPGYKDFEKNDLIEAYIEAKKLSETQDFTLMKTWSHDAVKVLEDDSLDFVFIDGNHAYEYVVEDIAKWSKKVRPGGIVYGHDFDDYSNSKRWKEMNVMNAVEGWTKSYKIHPWFVLEGNKNKSWMYVK